jgi:hypothetical protein
VVIPGVRVFERFFGISARNVIDIHVWDVIVVVHDVGGTGQRDVAGINRYCACNTSERKISSINVSRHSNDKTDLSS